MGTLISRLQPFFSILTTCWIIWAAVPTNTPAADGPTETQAATGFVAAPVQPALAPAARPQPSSDRRPNIVVCMADDWSSPHAGILGDPVVKTPHFDRIAREGILFENAFVSTPSCTPSRLSILTGQHHWRLKEGDSLGGSLRREFKVYTELLQTAGYDVGRFGKGVWPSKHTFRQRDAFGDKFSSFETFLAARDPSRPFCFWYGGQDPHRPYDLGIGEKSGISVDAMSVPECLPDSETIRSDLADYLWEVQRFDHNVGEILAALEATGELENTILVVSGDNGMPFPRCKATLYDTGTRVPLAIRWGDRLEGGRRVLDFTSLCDLAPTFLQAAGISRPSQMTGRSLIPILEAKGSGLIDPTRTFVLTGMEQHVYANPSRAIRTENFLYVRNFDPLAWRTGETNGQNPEYDFAETAWPTDEGAFSFNIDPSPSKQFLRLNRDEPKVQPYAELAFGRRAEEELYDLSSDPGQLRNVAAEADYRATKRRLRRQLDAELIKSADPRLAVEGYFTKALEGWPIRVSDRLVSEQPEKTAAALELLREQLTRVVGVVPATALSQLRDVPIWLSPEYPGVRPTAEYHPGAAWLRKAARHTDLVECVELTNINRFEQECKRMPMMILHELAHAYHHQVLGFDNARVMSSYERAATSGSYAAVARNNGRTERAYAMSNHKEYFAECSEAYFGENDFYPFNRRQLIEHDPQIATVLRQLWGAKPRSTVVD